MTNATDAMDSQIIKVNRDSSVEVDIVPHVNGVGVILEDVTWLREVVQG